jgi:outer membrane protein OmpA-like peptidoglycan-associated protein
MRAVLVVAVLIVSSCGSKAKPAADPDPEPRTLTVTETIVEVIDYTFFAPDSAEIAADQTALLDAIASTLEANPEITKVEVQGHADAGERDPAAVSQARADAVVAYLVAKGVDAGRLVAKGYGTDAPLPTEDPAEQATANRAVGYMILERSAP